MTALNWNIFKAKFHQREQSAFESLSYMLFCEDGSGKTALIKEIRSASNPLYVLKAAEFNRASVNDIFHDFGQFELTDFIDAHKEEAGRTFVIDSAEKLADLENQEVFIEFLSALITRATLFNVIDTYLCDYKARKAYA